MIMALQWIDGGDYITTNVWPSASGLSPWDGFLVNIGNISVGTGFARTGLNGYRTAGGAMVKNLTGNFQTAVIGAAVDMTGTPSANNIGVLGFSDNGSNAIYVGVNNNGTLFVNAQNIGSITNSLTGTLNSSYQLPFGAYHYLEFKVTIAATGSVSIWADSLLVFQNTNTNTLKTNPYVNQAYFGNTDNAFRTPMFVDDIYILDTSGPAPWNDRLGDIAVVAYVPVSAGSFTQWTPVGNAQNWQNENQIPSKAFTFYNDTTASGQRDSYDYTFTQPVNTGQIFGVMPLALMETVSAGTRTVELTARQAGVDAFSPSYTLGVGFLYILSGGAKWLLETDVNGNPWTITNLQATEFGVDEIT
jgi:hypothetical protein